MTSRKTEKPAPSKTATAVSARHTPPQAIYDPTTAIQEHWAPERLSGAEGSHQRVIPYIQKFLHHVNINYSALDPERANEFRAFSGAHTITHHRDDAPGLLEYTINASFKSALDLIHSYVGTYQSVKVDLGKVDKNDFASVYRNGKETSKVYNVDDFAGSEVADRFKGDDDANVFYGGGGDDKIWGRGGNDQLSGGAGDDIIRGGSGHDLIWGNQGNDTLYGGRGNDWLHGEQGADDLYGGKGADTFAYARVSESTGNTKDTLHDFSIKDGDVLDFSKLIDTFKRPEDVKIWLTDLADNAGTTVHVGYGPKSKHVLSLDLMGVKAEDLQHSAESFKLGQHSIEVEYGVPSVDDDVIPVVGGTPQALALKHAPDVTESTPREVTHPVSGTKSNLAAVDRQIDHFEFASQGQYTIDGFNLGDGDTLDFSKVLKTFETPEEIEMRLIHNPDGAIGSFYDGETSYTIGDTDPTGTTIYIGPRNQDSGTAGTLSVHLKNVTAEDLLCADAINTGDSLEVPSEYYIIEHFVSSSFTCPSAPKDPDVVGQSSLSGDGYGTSLL